MNVNTSPVTDNVTEILNRILDFTERRKELLSRNLFDYKNKEFIPHDLPVHEFAGAMTRALAEHLQNKRLLLEDSPNIHFLDQGDFDAAAVVDQDAHQLLNQDAQAYLNQQIQKLSENMIHNRIANELLRQKRQKELQLT
jgi:flagellar basal body rod protein FlgB